MENTRKTLKILSLPLIGLAIYVLYVINMPVFCPFNKITGLYCPGCGITRSMVAVMHFDFSEAFRYNPLIMILSPILVPYAVYSYYIWSFEKEDKITKRIPNLFWYSLIFIFLIFGILRNVFEWL